MKKIIYTITLSLSTFVGFSQNGEISIEQDEKITELIDIYSSSNENSNVYRIQVFFGSFQKAQNIKNKVDVDFPGWYSKIDFESPSYRVRVGKFKTKLKAEQKLIEVRKKYPNAMLLKPKKTTK